MGLVYRESIVVAQHVMADKRWQPQRLWPDLVDAIRLWIALNLFIVLLVDAIKTFPKWFVHHRYYYYTCNLVKTIITNRVFF